ncbi:MAG: TldD/PmbA family protein [Bdellovibrionales bacterium]|nr:TldD/PmbA family protein [Bdellovibrionales bacterium]
MKPTLESALDFIKHHPKLVIAEDYEILCQKTETHSCYFKNGEAIEESRDSRWWIQMRILHRKRLGSTSTVFCNEQSLNSMVDKAFELADNTTVDPWFRFPLWKPALLEKTTIKESGSVDSALKEVFFETLFPELASPPIGLEERYFRQQEHRTLLRKTEKMILSDESEIQQFQFALVNRGAGGEFYRLEDIRGGSAPFLAKGAVLDALLRKSTRLNRLQVATKVIPGSYLLAGIVVASLLKSIESYFGGPLAGLGKTPLANLLGKPVFSDAVSLTDDGLYLGGEGTRPFDCEGATSQQTKVVESGILKTFLHDANSAAKYNRTSTGNLIRAPNNISRVGATNFYLNPSTTRLSELFSEMKEGVYIESVDRFHRELTRTGKLEILGQGWIVKNGEPTGPPQQLLLTVDPLEILKEITVVASDLSFWGRYGAPSVFLKKMPLGEI